MLSEFKYRGKDGQEPALIFYGMHDKLKDIVINEGNIRDDYDRMMWKGDYTTQDGFRYLYAVASEVRRIKSIPDNAHVELVEGSDEWNQASAQVSEKRESFLEEKRGKVDKNYAYRLLVGLAGMRINIYEQLVISRDLLVSFYDLAQEDYSASWTSASPQAEISLNHSIVDMIDYVDNIFPEAVSKLLDKFPRPESLEIKIPEKMLRQLHD